MLFPIRALLSAVQLMGILQLIVGEITTNNVTKTSFVCNDEILKTIGRKLEQLEFVNEYLRLKMDTLNIIIDNHFVELKAEKGTKVGNEIGRDSSKNINPHNCGYSYGHLIDIRGDFLGGPGCLPSSTSNTTSNGTSSATFAHSSGYLPTNCDEALRLSGRERGVHKIRVPDAIVKPFFVYCEPDPQNSHAAWTIIQRRSDGSINFFRDRNDYRNGFGNMEGEFFIGLDRLHALTESKLHELWIQLEDFEGHSRWAKYSSFAIGGPNEWFALRVLGAYTGDAGDSLTSQAGQKFTTKDVDKDEHETLNCAVEYTGAWWYGKCHQSNLNGMYLHGECPTEKFGKGIVWNTWHQYYYSLKYVHMAIRPVS